MPLVRLQTQRLLLRQGRRLGGAQACPAAARRLGSCCGVTFTFSSGWKGPDTSPSGLYVTLWLLRRLSSSQAHGRGPPEVGRGLCHWLCLCASLGSQCSLQAKTGSQRWHCSQAHPVRVATAGRLIWSVGMHGGLSRPGREEWEAWAEWVPLSLAASGTRGHTHTAPCGPAWASGPRGGLTSRLSLEPCPTCPLPSPLSCHFLWSTSVLLTSH